MNCKFEAKQSYESYEIRIWKCCVFCVRFSAFGHWNPEVVKRILFLKHLRKCELISIWHAQIYFILRLKGQISDKFTRAKSYQLQ